MLYWLAMNIQTTGVISVAMYCLACSKSHIQVLNGLRETARYPLCPAATVDGPK